MNSKYETVILDWGIGGLPLLAMFRRARTDADLLYISDAGFTPYGRVSESGLRARLSDIAEYAQCRGAVRLVVACNAMSTVLTHGVEYFAGKLEVLSLTHLWLESSAADSLASFSGEGASGKMSRIAVAGGIRTTEAGLYRQFLQERGHDVRDIVGQQLSRAIESGDQDEVRHLTFKLIEPHRHCDAIILACTHYPAAADIINEMFPHLEIIDPVMPLFDYLRSELAGGSGKSEYLTTGDPIQSALSADHAFSLSDLDFRKLPLDLSL